MPASRVESESNYQTEDKALAYYLKNMKEHCDNKC